MKNDYQEKEELLQSMDNENFVLKIFRLIPSRKIKFYGRALRCFRVERLIRSRFFSKSWVDSSSKSDTPPDFHNEKHHIMMEMMRIDDSVKKINGKKAINSFERANIYMEKHFECDYKNKMKGCSLFFVPDTSNDAQFKFKAYLKNFERVLINHSNKADEYRENYPKCKTLVLFICDESNGYYQKVAENKDLVHLCFNDSAFIEIIKRCKADYLVWFTMYKTAINSNKKIIKQPLACIYDVKHIKQTGVRYNHEKMIKIK